MTLLGKDSDNDIASFNEQLNKMMNTEVTEVNINDFGRFDLLKGCVDKTKAKAYFEKRDGVSLSPFKVNMEIDKLLQDFIISGGCDL